MNTEFERREFELEYPFTISRGTQETAAAVVVRVHDDDGNTGVGAAGPSAHYGETAGTVEAVMPDLLDVVERVDDPENLARIEAGLKQVVYDNPSARTAVSIACHDLAAKRVDRPLYEYWGLDPANSLETSYTIGIDDAETMREKTRTAVDRGYGTLKVKLGTDRDEELLATVRDAAPDATIRVDANEAWSPREAVNNIEWVADYGVEFVEQPVAAENPEGLQFVYERSALPIAADESCITASDVPRIADKCDIANLKLMKTGGLREAKRLIHAARAHGLDVMCGCMAESNASIAAAAHLAPLLDYADLDGSLLLADDAFDGVPMPAGHIDLESADRPGTGARET
ncbi:dipeptide epimerase [Halobacterium litoreum]|uniref:Dipeptide epimerase n=1 Tax=Halobacterium litoreum TaxID=2039234 RepID=A0ABD5NDQ9_9EURY|nr:dipeptide epimerase [Halobacterium litoreum]UHH13826.1 dipeptide epimerase [Halobacterium litoreum]